MPQLGGQVSLLSCFHDNNSESQDDTGMTSLPNGAPGTLNIPLVKVNYFLGSILSFHCKQQSRG